MNTENYKVIAVILLTGSLLGCVFLDESEDGYSAFIIAFLTTLVLSRYIVCHI